MQHLRIGSGKTKSAPDGPNEALAHTGGVRQLAREPLPLSCSYVRQARKSAKSTAVAASPVVRCRDSPAEELFGTLQGFSKRTGSGMTEIEFGSGLGRFRD
ncbi:hypothetical protein [Mesorhizobium carmichaelinearum]|uniref:hypothetical protein n=1 Tax=Mesorhizobium carmichaelinearum TaxID=1208188 RepID=UPI00117D63CB|nr:hypothetical protein [Mesorhizobium carmichaelinearum]